MRGSSSCAFCAGVHCRVQDRGLVLLFKSQAEELVIVQRKQLRNESSRTLQAILWSCCLILGFSAEFSPDLWILEQGRDRGLLLLPSASMPEAIIQRVPH